jgi:hypothetical protein
MAKHFSVTTNLKRGKREKDGSELTNMKPNKNIPKK